MSLIPNVVRKNVLQTLAAPTTGDPAAKPKSNEEFRKLLLK
jgi:Lsm interaction motif